MACANCQRDSNHDLLKATYVHRPVALLHVVGSEDVGRTSELVKEVVLETEHGRGADDGGLRVDRASNLLTPGLQQSAPIRQRDKNPTNEPW